MMLTSSRIAGNLISPAMSLDIGGGATSLGTLTIDINPKASIVHDLNTYPWPIRSNSVSAMRMSHVLEHLKEPFEAIKECFRIARQGAVLEVRIPWWKNEVGNINPAHLHTFRPKWFRNLNADSSVWNRDMEIHKAVDWKVIKEHKMRGRLRFWKVYEYHVWLRAAKGET